MLQYTPVPKVLQMDEEPSSHTMLLSFTIHLRIHKVFPIDHMRSENSPGCLSYVSIAVPSCTEMNTDDYKGPYSPTRISSNQTVVLLHGFYFYISNVYIYTVYIWYIYNIYS